VNSESDETLDRIPYSFTFSCFFQGLSHFFVSVTRSTSG
jgi:hypothetical protein